MSSSPTIVIHGGAWAIPDRLVDASVAGVLAAASAGYRRLVAESKAGDSTKPKQRSAALEAVQAAVESMETDPVFDAGIGSVLTSEGQVEMDAVVMDGASLEAGAVACVRNVTHPVGVARRVMEATPHVLIVGEGATKFARDQGFEFVSTESLVTEEAKRKLEEYLKFDTTIKKLFSAASTSHDTVGAVAVDVDGNVAAATSTGGITAKRPGRVGDSPIVGAGAYADNESVAASCTGNGEAILKTSLARLVSFKTSAGAPVQCAVDEALSEMRRRVGGCGGVVAVDATGNPGVSFTTERMPWVIVKEGKTTFGIEPGEVRVLGEGGDATGN